MKIHYVVSAANGDPNAVTPEQIFRVNSQLAEEGNSQAEFELGLAYMQGDGVRTDLHAAEMWFEKGAVTPDKKAFVGMFYADGIGFPLDAAKADHWYRAAGRPGDLFALSEMYRTAIPSQTQQAAKIYEDLLNHPEAPEFRRAQLELGNLVVDGKYTAGTDDAARKKNLEWARAITLELVGNENYDIAVDFTAGRNDLAKNRAMRARYCLRAAEYNIDLAQQFYGEAISSGEVPGGQPWAAAWLRLASEKRHDSRPMLRAVEAKLDPSGHEAEEANYKQLLKAKQQAGAFYAPEDPLLGPSPDALASISANDPDVRLRRAFMPEASATTETYDQTLNEYRDLRDHRFALVRLAVGRNALLGTNGIDRNPDIAQHYLHAAADAGSKEAAQLLLTLKSNEQEKSGK